MSQLGERLRWVAESLLENESLTADLDEEAAQGILDWGLALAEEIVQSTARLDDVKAEEAMEPRLQALRRLLRDASHFLAHTQRLTPEQAVRALDGLTRYAQKVYGAGYVAPETAARRAFVQTLSSRLSATQLRAFLQGEPPLQLAAQNKEMMWQTAVAPLTDLDDRYEMEQEEE